MPLAAELAARLLARGAILPSEVKVAAIIPALDEEQALGQTLQQLPVGVFERVLVVDNGSRDRTSEVAAAHGARVIGEPFRGYGAACLAGIAALAPDIEAVVFLDADGSDQPQEAELLIAPIRSGEADLVIGSRELGVRESGSLRLHQRWGNHFAVLLIQLFFGHRYTDLGPFRAIRRKSLDSLGMQDRGYGWTIEMQVRALRKGLRIKEAPVSHRVRVGGRSKISGNLWNSLAAGAKILWTVARLRLA